MIFNLDTGLQIGRIPNRIFKISNQNKSEIENPESDIQNELSS